MVLAAKENHMWMIEEKEEEKVEALETVELVNEKPMKTTKIRTTISADTKKKLVQFLKENLDIFRLEPRGHARHIPRDYPTQVRCGPREKANLIETMSVCSRTKLVNHGRSK